MTNNLKKAHFGRCARKRRFRNPNIADEFAQQASLRTGELIISYQCYDCGKWHIGHADLSQILARIPPNGPTCIICGQRIPESRIEKAKRWGSPTQACSKPCTQEMRRRRAQQKRVDQLTPTDDSPQS
jgi:hypothetical protein